ncbi:hypothetical protein MEO40_25340 [Dolichospermum sp. ST_sed1]|nr:hypothetical protein [Dolichospermum sp. ST_sed1]
MIKSIEEFEVKYLNITNKGTLTDKDKKDLKNLDGRLKKFIQTNNQIAVAMLSSNIRIREIASNMKAIL